MAKSQYLSPPDFSEAAIAKRDRNDDPDPSFVVNTVWFPRQSATGTKARAEVSIGIAAKGGEPVFLFVLLRSDEVGMQWQLPLSDLIRGKEPDPIHGHDDLLELSNKTREAMLVWWDQNNGWLEHQDEMIDEGYKVKGALARDLDISAVARDSGPGTAMELAERVAYEDDFMGDFRERAIELSEELGMPSQAAISLFEQGAILALADLIGEDRKKNPKAADVTRALQAAGLRVQQCGLNADWSVLAWHLSPDRPNVTSGDLYLTDTEGETNDGSSEFTVVRQILTEAGDSEVEEIAAGTLEEMIARAKIEVTHNQLELTRELEPRDRN